MVSAGRDRENNRPGSHEPGSPESGLRNPGPDRYRTDTDRRTAADMALASLGGYRLGCRSVGRTDGQTDGQHHQQQQPQQEPQEQQQQQQHATMSVWADTFIVVKSYRRSHSVHRVACVIPEHGHEPTERRASN